MRLDLKIITCTGPDDDTPVPSLVDLAARYRQAEIGLPLCPERGGKWLGYPSVSFIRTFAAQAQNLSQEGGPVIRASLHVRKAWVDDLSQNIVRRIPKELMEMRHGNGTAVFQRIHLNLSDPAKVNPDNLKALFQERKGQRFILPVHKPTEQLCRRLVEEDAGFDLIFDKSQGTGILPAIWPEGIAGYFCAYAGGLNPENVRDELKKISRVAKGEIGIDAETGLKDKNGRFSLRRAESYIKAAYSFE